MTKKTFKMFDLLRSSYVALILFFITNIANAQTSPSTQGIPTSGAIGEILLNLFLITVSVLVLSAGLAYAYREKV